MPIPETPEPDDAPADGLLTILADIVSLALMIVVGAGVLILLAGFAG